MARTSLSISCVALVAAGILLVQITLANAATYTYTRTIDSSYLGKYYYEISTAYTVPGQNACNALPGNFYSSQSECQAVLSQRLQEIPNTPNYSGASVLSNCSQVTKTTSTYTLNMPACASTIADKGLVLQGGGGALPGGNDGGGGGSLPGGNAGGGGGDGGSSGLTNPLKVDSLPEFLRAILRGVVQIGAIFLTFMVVYVGFLFVAARGNEEKIRSAREALVWTVIGGLILLGAEAISLVIENTVKTL